jgi:hypothetical protein
MAMKTGVMHDPAAAMFDADRSVMSDTAGEKWPVWLRVLTIISLSAGMWAAIIWGLVSIFG